MTGLHDLVQGVLPGTPPAPTLARSERPTDNLETGSAYMIAGLIERLTPASRARELAQEVIDLAVDIQAGRDVLVTQLLEQQDEIDDLERRIKSIEGGF